MASQLEVVLNEVHVPGMVIGLVRGDSTWVLPIGYTDPARTTSTSAATPYYIASVTKVFTAQAVLQLVHEGRIDLDAPVKKYLTRFAVADAAATDSISIRDLLCHATGLESWPITFGEAFTGQMTEERYYRLLAQVHPEGSFSYSNLHYTLLGRVIEAVTGKDWKSYLSEAVFRPAGMHATSTSAAALMSTSAAVPTEFVNDTLRAVDERKTDRTMHAAGGMVSTADDLLRWLRLQINEGRDASGVVFPAEVIRSMRTSQLDIPDDHPFIPEQQRVGWGLGWMIRAHRDVRYIVHNGHFKGWAAHLSYLPEHRMGVVILVNNKNTGMWLTEALAVYMYERLLGMETRDYLAEIPEMLTAPAASEAPANGTMRTTGPEGLSWSAFVGRYTNADWGSLEVSSSSDGITMHIGDLPLPLVWKDAGTFIAGGDHEGSFVITDGKVSAVDLGMPLPDRARFQR